MPKKEWTPEERKAFGDKMRAAKAERKQKEYEGPRDLGIDETTHVAPEQGVDDLQRQIEELKQSIAQLTNKQNSTETPQMNKTGDLIGEWEKYIVDPAHYPDPIPRLKAEARLQPIAFNHNYELEYDVAVSSYETKSGKNVKEPKFMINLNRIVLDDQGEPTLKRYVARKMVFHEDPQAALVIARENGYPVDKSNEKQFLDEMRYLRVRDWLFGIFWPKPADPMAKIREEVIGGTVVQVFTKNSVEPSEIEFSKIHKAV